MKTIIFICLVLSVCPFWICAQSAGNQQLVNEFTSSEPTSDQLAAFNQRALQKLKDYANYIEIISTTSYDEAFRKQAVDMAIALFEDKNAMICDSLIEIHKVRKTAAGDYFNKLLKLNYQKVTLGLTDVLMTEPLKKSDIAGYSGTISFKETVSLFSATSKNPKTRTYTKKVSVILKKVSKDFGSQKKIIWEVMLGSIQ